MPRPTHTIFLLLAHAFNETFCLKEKRRHESRLRLMKQSVTHHQHFCSIQERCSARKACVKGWEDAKNCKLQIADLQTNMEPEKKQKHPQKQTRKNNLQTKTKFALCTGLFVHNKHFKKANVLLTAAKYQVNVKVGVLWRQINLIDLPLDFFVKRTVENFYLSSSTLCFLIFFCFSAARKNKLQSVLHETMRKTTNEEIRFLQVPNYSSSWEERVLGRVRNFATCILEQTCGMFIGPSHCYFF